LGGPFFRGLPRFFPNLRRVFGFHRNFFPRGAVSCTFSRDYLGEFMGALRVNKVPFSGGFFYQQGVWLFSSFGAFLPWGFFHGTILWGGFSGEFFAEKTAGVSLSRQGCCPLSRGRRPHGACLALDCV